MKRALLVTFLAIAVSPMAASAAPPVPERQLAHARITLGDVVERAPGELAAIDLGPAPAAGASRLLRRDEVLAALPQDADPKKLEVPEVVRVVRKARTLPPAEIDALVTRALASSPLPKGVSLTATKPAAKGATVPDGFDGVRIEVPKPPRREGRVSSSATVLLTEAGFVVAKLQVPVELAVSSAGALPDVKKGERLALVVRRGLVEIRATVTANADADVGDFLQVTVGDSGKALRVRLAAANPPVAEEAP